MKRLYDVGHGGLETDGERLAVVCADGWVDWPVRLPDGRVTWDSPERVPVYLKEAAVREFDKARVEGRTYTSDRLPLPLREFFGL